MSFEFEDDWAFRLTEDLSWGRHNGRARVWYRLGPVVPIDNGNVATERVMGRVEIVLGHWNWSVGFGSYARHNQKVARGKAAQLREALEAANGLLDPLIAAVQLGWQPSRADFTAWAASLLR